MLPSLRYSSARCRVSLACRYQTKPCAGNPRCAIPIQSKSAVGFWKCDTFGDQRALPIRNSRCVSTDTNTPSIDPTTLSTIDHVTKDTNPRTATEDLYEKLEHTSLSLLTQTPISLSHQTDIVKVLEAWKLLLPKLQELDEIPDRMLPTNQCSAAISRMQDLYELWKRRPIVTNRPFQIMLEVFAHTPTISDNSNARGMAALQVLEDWNRSFMGDMELEPRRTDYHLVLHAFGNQPLSLSSAYIEPTTAAQPGEVAQEIMTQLVAWGVTMKPTAETYQLAIRCLTRGIQQLTTSWDNERDTEVMSNVEQLQHTVREYASRLINLTVSSGSSSSMTIWLGLSDAFQAMHVPLDRFEEDGPKRIQDADWYRQTLPVWKQALIESRRALDRRILRENMDRTCKALLLLHERYLEPAEQITAIRDTLEELKGLYTSLPSAEHYCIAINSLTSMKESVAKKFALDLAVSMEKQHRRKFDSSQSDGCLDSEEMVKSWNLLMTVYMQVGELSKVLDLWKEMTVNKIPRNSLSLFLVLKVLAQQETSQSANQATSILFKYLSMDRKPFEPTAEHFRCVMMAWCNSRDRHAASQCQRVFDRMLQYSAESRKQLRSDGTEKPTLEPHALHFTALIKTLGYSRRPDAAKKVSALLVEMLELGLDPDLQTYTSFFSALSHTKSLQGAEEAQEWYDKLQKECSKVVLNVHCYASVMFAWTKSGAVDAPERCRAIFDELWRAYLSTPASEEGDLRPTSAVYRALMEAWASSGRAQAPDEVDALLSLMEKKAEQGLIDPPDKKVYALVMATHWKHNDRNAVAKVQDVYSRMTASYEMGNIAAKPDAHCQTILMNAWAKSDVPERAKIVLDLLREMFQAYSQGDLDMQPNAYALAAVLNACAFVDKDNETLRRQAVQIALTAFNDFSNSELEGTNPFIYCYLFRVLGHQVDDMVERTRLASVIFQRESIVKT